MMHVIMPALLFQSTHPRRVRLLQDTGVWRCHYRFNPRTHAGCDCYDCNKLHGGRVSIHAPTQGATAAISGWIRPALFQSTHPRRVRPRIALATAMTTCFNPRTHAGCDLGAIQLQGCKQAGFNPRTHAGCDLGEAVLYQANGQVSIHAPTQGAT